MSSFLEQVRLIRQQLDLHHHPIRLIVDYFVECFIESNRCLMYENGFDQQFYKFNASRCLSELNTFITIIYETVVTYYELRSYLASGMKRQQIEHLVKSLVL